MSENRIPEGFVQIQDPDNDGGYLVLHRRDFNPAVHHLFGAPTAKPSAAVPPAGAGTDKTPGGISTVNSESALSLVAKVDKAEDLDALESDEKSSEKHPGGRKGVLAAIADRRKALAG